MLTAMAPPSPCFADNFLDPRDESVNADIFFLQYDNMKAKTSDCFLLDFWTMLHKRRKCYRPWFYSFFRRKWLKTLSVETEKVTSVVFWRKVPNCKLRFAKMLHFIAKIAVFGVENR